MENPEEVLQALDEFQKMRPSEIPRELEDYLSWVAKTGDPVYQWSLVKPLFREKLTRVMTDFYESCPSLELAPCPNVDQFNYDFMKCNLLELLESFANAPFTVQRICELLTSPRKEYNRVDKFMRAIEKNILVVSTVEPGPAARRSENGAAGEAMVNGGLDEETPTPPVPPTHEVEMETWVKDCTGESSERLRDTRSDKSVDSVPSAGKIAKLTSNEEVSQIRVKSDETRRTADEDDVGGDANENSSRVAPDAAHTEISAAEGNHTSVASTEVAAVMNEDTNSQPALETETESSEPSVNRKLQTTFRTKDFARKEEDSSVEDKVKPDKSRVEDVELLDPSESRENRNDEAGGEKISLQSRDADAAPANDVPEKRARVDRLPDDLDGVESTSIAEEENASAETNPDAKKKCELRDDAPPAKCSKLEVPEGEALSTAGDDRPSDVEAEKIERLTTSDETKKERNEQSAEPESTSEETSKPIVEEPCYEESEEKVKAENNDVTCAQRVGGVTIEEAMDDDARVNDKSIVPDPIPIVEEPKDLETAPKSPETTTVITEIPEVTPEEPITNENTSVLVDTSSCRAEVTTAENVEESIASVDPEIREDITDVRCPEDSAPIEKIEPAESMEIDGEESLPTFQQDEPMEQEPGDVLKS